ncbi:hypothetical protein RSAG8_07206, partial [Rhizoctonia solani AG-8 WAC10335]
MSAVEKLIIGLRVWTATSLLHLDQVPVDLGAPRPLTDFEFGSEGYRRNYKKALALETKERTHLDPHDWQLDVALNSHLGPDVFLLAGTGSGRTLALVMPAFLDLNLKIFLVSPLNALANAQVVEFDHWKLKAVPVNAITKYKNLKKYALVGTLKLLLIGEVPMIAATATANNLMRQAIKQSLRFGSDAFEVNLGNRRPNIAYSVHRVRNVSAVATELLEYFPSKSELPEFTIIFVDPIGTSLDNWLKASSFRVSHQNVV